VSKTILPFDPYISRDLSWLAFNRRVLALAQDPKLSPFDRLRFLAITASNQDEFFMIRLGSLYNYVDYKTRTNNRNPKIERLLKKLHEEAHEFHQQQQKVYLQSLLPAIKKANCFLIKDITKLNKGTQKQLEDYFDQVIFPMLTPMSFDENQAIPVLRNRASAFCVVTRNTAKKQPQSRTYSFVQLPSNLPRFYEIPTTTKHYFIPIEEIIRKHFSKLFHNVEVLEAVLLRVTRNGDFSLEESEDIEEKILEELKRQLKKRNTGDIIRLELEKSCSKDTLNLLKRKCDIDDRNVFFVDRKSLINFISLNQLAKHSSFSGQLPVKHSPVLPLTYPDQTGDSLFDILKKQDILIHRPYNSFSLVINLLEEAAEDPHVLAIKLTVYRLAEDSAVIRALLKAAQNGKHVAVLIELKARFDEEHNIQEAKRLQKAGCSVIYGKIDMKTHAKLLFIVRQEDHQVNSYVHMSSGNYNEETAQYYTDVSLFTTDPGYAKDVSNFFNVITGHSFPQHYDNLITAPVDLREKLLSFIDREISFAKKGLKSGIVFKLNALSDKIIIDELYKASQAGVPIELIVRGICCLIPGRKGFSDNITVRSIVGEFLEHARIFYFHNQNDPTIYIGSADIMVRSFDNRIESLFLIKNKIHKQEIIHILSYNLRDNFNTYLMKEDGTYEKINSGKKEIFNVHHAFYEVTLEEVMKAKLFQ